MNTHAISLILIFTTEILSSATTSKPPVAEAIQGSSSRSPAAIERQKRAELLRGVAKIDEDTQLGRAIRVCEKGDYEEGLRLLEALSGEGDMEAVYVIGKLHLLGLGVEKSASKAREYFEQAGDKGHATSLVELGLLSESEDPELALMFFRQAAEAGQAYANLKLGFCHETGQLGAAKNPKLAYTLYQKAADAGVADATFALSRCLETGIGTSADALKGARMCRQAALEGVVDAQLDMAVRYFEGKGVEEDPVAAVGWLTVASQNGSANAQFLLGLRYERGDAVLQDFDQAGRLYTLASKQGNLASAHRLALLYRDGKGTRMDPIRAYVILSEAMAYEPAEKDLMELVKSMTEKQFEEAQASLLVARKEMGATQE